MSKMLKSLVATAALLAAAPAAQAQPFGRPDLGRYDAAHAPSLAQQLVLCDLASYFGTKPDLNATRVYLQRDNHRFEPSFPLAITRGASWHDENLERAFMRHRTAGRVTSQEVDALRLQYGMEMEQGFKRMNVREQRFFQSQAPFCRNLERASWR